MVKRIVAVASRWRWVADGGAVLLGNAIAGFHGGAVFFGNVIAGGATDCNGGSQVAVGCRWWCVCVFRECHLQIFCVFKECHCRFPCKRWRGVVGIAGSQTHCKGGLQVALGNCIQRDANRLVMVASSWESAEKVEILKEK